MERLLGTLTKREEQIVRLRHGVSTTARHTQRQVSELIGLSSSRVGQIELKAFRRLAWIINACPDGDTVAVEELIREREAAAAEQAQERERAHNALLRQMERRRLEKDQRDELRRAKARSGAWKRKLALAQNEHQKLCEQARAVGYRIDRMERRCWLTRWLFASASRLATLRDEEQRIKSAIEVSDLAIAKIRLSDPELSADKPITDPRTAEERPLTQNMRLNQTGDEPCPEN